MLQVAHSRRPTIATCAATRPSPSLPYPRPNPIRFSFPSRLFTICTAQPPLQRQPCIANHPTVPLQGYLFIYVAKALPFQMQASSAAKATEPWMRPPNPLSTPISQQNIPPQLLPPPHHLHVSNEGYHTPTQSSRNNQMQTMQCRKRGANTAKRGCKETGGIARGAH